MTDSNELIQYHFGLRSGGIYIAITLSASRHPPGHQLGWRQSPPTASNTCTERSHGQDHLSIDSRLLAWSSLSPSLSWPSPLSLWSPLSLDMALSRSSPPLVWSSLNTQTRQQPTPITSAIPIIPPILVAVIASRIVVGKSWGAASSQDQRPQHKRY